MLARTGCETSNTAGGIRVGGENECLRQSCQAERKAYLCNRIGTTLLRKMKVSGLLSVGRVLGTDDGKFDPNDSKAVSEVMWTKKFEFVVSRQHPGSSEGQQLF